MKLGKVKIEGNDETNSAGKSSEKSGGGRGNELQFAIQNLDSEKMTGESQVISVSVIKDNVSASNDSFNDRAESVVDVE